MTGSYESSVMVRLGKFDEQLRHINYLYCTTYFAQGMHKDCLIGNAQLDSLQRLKRKFEQAEFCWEDDLAAYYGAMMQLFGEAIVGKPSRAVRRVLDELPHPFDTYAPDMDTRSRALTKGFVYGTREFRLHNGVYVPQKWHELAAHRAQLYREFRLTRQGTPTILKAADQAHYNGLSPLHKRVIEIRNVHYGRTPDVWERFLKDLDVGSEPERDAMAAAIEQLKAYEQEHGINWAWPYARHSRRSKRAKRSETSRPAQSAG